MSRWGKSSGGFAGAANREISPDAWEDAKAAFATSEIRLLDLPADHVLGHLPSATADLPGDRFQIWHRVR